MVESPSSTPQSELPPAQADDARYHIERKIGEGGAAAVYLAKDRESGEHVALKKLFRMDAKSVLRLKREFRSLVDINHPHIIKLYDMGRTGDGWFLTMEYLEGVDLTRYLAQSEQARRRAGEPQSLERLLSSFDQLARGVHALHQAGMLHRDLKPSNVLVVDHRVIVLDFGLVYELSPNAATVTEDGAVSGTPAYMAPEQLRGLELDAACDWYAFGVMLYEALSGHLPIEGSLIEILRRKLDADPVPIHRFAPSAPKEVLDLCMALLHRDPTRRPGAEQIFAALRSSGQEPETAQRHSQHDLVFRTETELRSITGKLFGRQLEMTALWKALHEAEDAAESVVVHVRGESGAGKSALIENFLDGVETPDVIASRGGALVLRSRCYELEAMPFKALDGVVDALARHLSKLDDIEVAHMLPVDIAALSQLFPVLEQLPAVKDLVARRKLAPDALLDRQRAETALRGLLDAVADYQLVVVWIDDLHWGDLDSARILQSWLLQPSNSSILFVFSYRSEEIGSSSCLERLLERDKTAAAPPGREHVIDIAGLADSELRALCELRLGARAGAHPGIVERIVREAQGSPFLASQLTAVAEAKLERGDTDWAGVSINALIEQTSDLLLPEAKRLLAVLAVAGKPIEPKLALLAANIQRHGRRLVHSLRGLNLVRAREVGGVRMLAVYHDRVRESVRASLAADESQLVHASLLQAFKFADPIDPDFLHALALGAGQRVEALSYGHAAAERASASLAFERAAEVYRRCIELADAAEASALWKKLAAALGCCGRGLQASDAYLEAAKLVPVREAIGLRQLAAAHLLRSGHFEQGEIVMNRVIADMNVSLPDSDRGVMAAIVWERARLKLRGMNIRLRAQDEAPRELLEQHDMFENLGSVFLQFDPLRAGLFHFRGLYCALEAGEPNRVVHALCRVATRTALAATPEAAEESDGLLARAEQLARESAQPALSMTACTRVFTSFHLARHRQVVDLSEVALDTFRNSSGAEARANYYRRHIVAAMRIGSLYELGRYEQMCAELNELLDEARATENRSLLLNTSTARVLSEEILDIPGASRAQLEQQANELPKNRFGLLHVVHMSALSTAACSTGDYAAASEFLDAHWERYLRSPIGRGGGLGSRLHATRARMVLNQFVVHGADRARLRSVREDLAVLGKHASSPSTQRVAARLARIEGDKNKAIELLRRAISELEERGLLGEAARDRFALGALMGGTEGAKLCESAERQLRTLGAVNPKRMLRAYYPEFVDAG